MSSGLKKSYTYLDKKFNFFTRNFEFTYILYLLRIYRLMINDYEIVVKFFLYHLSAITWHDIQQLSINLPSLFNLWTDKTIHVNLCKKCAIDVKKNNLYYVGMYKQAKIKKYVGNF